MLNSPGRVGRVGVTARRRVPPAAASALLMMVAGQSNARKAGTSGVTPPSRYTSLTDVKMWNSATGVFDTYLAGSNSGHYATEPNWGSEAEFIYQMRANGDTRTVYLVKDATNGAAINSAAASTWHPDTSGDRFATLEAQKALARAAIAETTVEEVTLWNQGGADARDPVFYSEFPAQFAYFLSQYRSRISTGKFILERTRTIGRTAGGASGDNTGYSQETVVREGQIAAVLADGNAAAVDADFDPTNMLDSHPIEPDAGSWTLAGSWTSSLGLRDYARYAGTYDATYGNVYDAVPNAFSFTASEAETSTVATSDTVQVSGLERQCAISITGGEYRILNVGGGVFADWTSSAGTLHKFQSVQLRATAPGTAGNVQNVVLTAGGVDSTWALTATAPVSYEAETTAFLAKVASEGGASFSTPQKDALDVFYETAKASTWWAKIVTLRFRFNSEIANKIDMVDQTTIAAQQNLGNLLPWVSGQGFKPNNNNQGLNLQANPSTETTQNSVGVGAYMETLSEDLDYDLYSDSTAIGLRVLSTSIRGKTHSANVSATGLTNSPGFYHLNRSGASANQFYGPAGTQVATSTTASAAPTATTFTIGTGATNADRAVGAAWLTLSLSAGEVQSFRDAIVALRSAF